MEVEGVRARSFRYEEYNKRRVFLRSYPLHWGGDEEVGENVSSSRERKRGAKERILATFHLGGGKALLLRKLKHKVALYLVSCRAFGFKPTTSLISV